MNRFFVKWIITAAFLIAVLWMPFSRVYAAGNTVVFSDAGAEGNGTGYSISETSLTIKASGVYEISGSCANGSITVNKNLQDVVLKLKDLNLSSAFTAPLMIGKSAEVIIIVEGRTVLADNEPADSPEMEGACIKLKSGASAEFRGEGTLEIHGNVKHGIKGGAGAKLIFNNETDGTVTVTAANNGIASDGSITVNAGNLVVTSAGDALKSVPDAEDTESDGTVVINGGTINIQTDGDGIQAETITVNAGILEIKTFDGFKSYGTNLYRKVYGGHNDQTRVFDPKTMSSKGLKASGDREKECMLEVKGGTFTLDCADDAVHSDGCVRILSGVFSISAGDDGIHGDSTLILGDESERNRWPEITISNSYEGFDGGNIDIYAGRYTVTACDDGINASWGDGSIVSNNHVNVHGGNLRIDSLGDGIDSNGEINLLGGRLIITSQRRGGVESPLDAGVSLFIYGAEVLAVGTPGVDGLAGPSCFGKGQNYVISTEMYIPGSTITAKCGDVLSCSVDTRRYVDYVLYSAPSGKNLSIHVFLKGLAYPGTGADNTPAGTGNESTEKETDSQETTDPEQPAAPAQPETPKAAAEENKTESSSEKKEEPVEKKSAKEAAAPVLLAKLTALKETKLRLKWTKIPSADGYEILFGSCKSGDTKKGYKLLKTIRKDGKRAYTITGLKKNHAYKAIVKAYKYVKGKKKYLTASCSLHALTADSNARFCNPKAVILKKKKITLKTGKTFVMNGTKITKAVSGRKLLAHVRKFRYAASDSTVAAVSKTGKITAKAPGTCRIYVIAGNGVYASVKVIVR